MHYECINPMLHYFFFQIYDSFITFTIGRYLITLFCHNKYESEYVIGITTDSGECNTLFILHCAKCVRHF